MIWHLGLLKDRCGWPDAYCASKPQVENSDKCNIDPQEVSKDVWLKRPSGFNDFQQEAFFGRNLTEGLVSTLPSGVQFVVLREGCGPKPKMHDLVEVRYHGTLLGGKVFDSSYLRGETAVFELGSVIVGWRDAVQHMKVGAIWEIYIPYDLAYGSRRTGPIPAYAPLLFTVELVSIK